MFEWWVRELYQAIDHELKAGQTDGVERDVIGRGDRPGADGDTTPRSAQRCDPLLEDRADGRLLCSQTPRIRPVPLSELK